MIVFKWDEAKCIKNQRKHGVSFAEARSVFYDDFAIQFYDEIHSQLEEDRYLMLGMSNKSRLLLVCHCELESENTLRIISARKATKTESKYYRK